VLTTFGSNLADTYAAEDVLARIARVLSEGVGAELARVWLGAGAARRVVASWPDDAPSGGTDDVVEEVRHRGDVLGALSVRMPASDPMDDPRAKLVSDLAAQAGLVLRQNEDNHYLLRVTGAPSRRVELVTRIKGQELTSDDAIRAARLPMHHRDPFDRMILAQALRLDAVVVSRDRVFDAYDVPVLHA